LYAEGTLAKQPRSTASLLMELKALRMSTCNTT
jgi:hypothetical protein